MGLIHLTHFFTSWAMVSHGLYAVSLIPCTFSIALTTCVGGLFHNLFFNDSYSFPIDFAVHYAPAIGFAILVAKGKIPAKALWRWDVLVASLSLYSLFILVNRIDVWHTYTHTSETLNQ